MTSSVARPTAPGPTGSDMIASVRRIRRDAPGFLADCRDRWGDVVEFPVPGPPVYLISAPDAVRRVLQDNHRNYDKATVQYRALSLVTGQGLLTSDGDLWRRQRRLEQPAFHASTLEAVAGRTAEAAGRVLARWDAVPDGSVVDVDAAMMQATLDVVGNALFGTDLHAGSGGFPVADGEDLVAAVLRALDVVVARARWPLSLPPRVPTPGNLRLRRSLRILDATVLAMVDTRRRRDRAGRLRDHDLLDLLLTARDGDLGMPDRQLRDEVVTLIVAGHETVAAALTWTWQLLAGDPTAAARLYAEVDSVVGRRAPSYADLGRLGWTRAVVEESLRLYPPAWVMTRRALGPDVLAGHHIPAGALVLVSPWVLHRHPEVWADPARFDPARFLPDRRGGVVRHAYLPFGAGPRLCIGRDFALVEATLLLAALSARYRVERVAGQKVHAAALVTIRPRHGLPMRLRRRVAPCVGPRSVGM